MADAVDFRNLAPDQLRKYVGSFVEITVCEIGKLQGWVYTIDPVSYNIVLAKAADENVHSKTIVVIMAKSVRQFRVLQTTGEPGWLKDFASKQRHDYSNEQLKKRKKDIIEWLKKNRVPIEESSEQENINVIGGLVIEPPYDVDSCQGTNEIVLERIRKLVNSMPND